MEEKISGKKMPEILNGILTSIVPFSEEAFHGDLLFRLQFDNAGLFLAKLGHIIQRIFHQGNKIFG